MTRTILCALVVAGCSSHSGGTTCTDEDQDGVTTCDGDCDDQDPLSYPGANELCGDNADNNCDMQADEGCPGGIGTFVSAVTGSDTNPGTKAMPVASVSKGILNAQTIGGSQTVVVAEGNYPEKITLVEDVDLVGGYECNASSCSWSRDLTLYMPVVANPDFEGVVGNAGVTSATLVEGFKIVGHDGAPTAAPGSAGVTLAGGSPTLRRNVIVGGNITSMAGYAIDRSVAIAVRSTTDPAGVRIEGNDLTGGTSTGISAGITLDSAGLVAPATTLATIGNNTIRGGSGRRSVGISAFNTAAGSLVSHNVILAGSSQGGASHGIEVGGTLTIDGNQINVDQTNVGTCLGATTWCAGIASQSSTSTIVNNIVFGPKGLRTAGVFLGEFEVAAGAVVLNGNTLNGGGLGAVPVGSISESAAVVVSIGTCNACGFNGFVGRVRNNILDGGINQNRYGVREDPAAGRTMRPELLENNLFWFAAATARIDTMYREISATGTPTDYKTITAINMLTRPPSAANVTGDPLLDASWHLMTGSPCIDTGTATEAPPTDFEGEARPGGAAVDIGHDESP
jgi:hypothetical protein